MHVVIVDSGVNRTHKLLREANIFSLQYKDREIICADADSDSFGHGTAITGIISRCEPKVQITVIGVPDLEEGLNESDLAWILEYINETQHADIINLSLGINICEDYERIYKVCKAITDNGTLIISAFDNAGAISYPAAFDNVIGVISGNSCRKTDDFVFIEDSIMNIAAKGSIQRVAWSVPEYIMIGGNSFACAHVTVQVIRFLMEGIKTREAILDKFKEISVKQCVLHSAGEQKQRLFSIYKAALFPFNKEMHSLIRYSDLLPFEICEIYDSKYSATVGATSAHLMKDDSVPDILVKNIRDIAWDHFDTLILGHMEELSTLINKDQLKKTLIEEALKRKKQIYSFDDLDEYEHSENIYSPRIDEKNLPPNRFGMLYRISKPVLGVFGTSSRQGKFTLQLKLRQMLLSSGYDVGQIGTEPSALLYGMDYVFPMGYNASVYINESDTVRYLNYIINNLCMQNKDIILVGSQSGTVSYDIGNLAQYPTLQYPFLIGTHPDAVILCINPFDEIEYIRRTIRFIMASVNCKVIALVVFPMDIREDWSGIYGTKEKLSDEKYQKLKRSLYSNLHISVFRLGDETDMKQLFQETLSFFS